MYYKFLSKQHVPSTIAGNLRFGRLRYYQLLEVVTGDDWIGDRHEGLATTRVHAVLDGNPNQAGLRQRLADAKFISAEGVSNIEIRGCKIINEVDCFVFCVAEGELSPLVARMCSPERAEYAYDGCLHLIDPVEIAQRLWNDGSVDGKPLHEIFLEIRFEQVRYEGQEYDLNDTPAVSGDPFVKAGKYKSQREWRFVLFPRIQIDRDSVSVRCDSIAALLVEEVLDVALPSHRPNDLADKSDDELIAEIRTIYRSWMAASSQVNEALWDWRARQDVSDEAGRRERSRRLTELTIEANRALNEQLNRKQRARLQKVYFEFRNRSHGLRFPEIDKAIAREFPPVLLAMEFRVAPFSIASGL